MTRRTFPIFVLAALLAGCVATPPLFRADAKPINRVYSGKELLAEAWTLAADLRDAGVIDQGVIDTQLDPALSAAELALAEAEAYVKAGDPVGAQTGLERAKSLLQGVLAHLERKQKEAKR